VVAVIEEAGTAPAAPPAKKKTAKAETAPPQAVAPPAPKAVPPPAAPEQEAVAAAPVEAAPEPLPAPAVDADSRVTRKRLSPLRRKIATQLVMAQQTAAILTTFNECDMTAVMTLRKQTQEAFQQQHGVKLGFMSFFVKATVAALKAVPQVNSRLEGEELITNHFYDVGVAVGTERGLVVPVVRDADQKSFAEIEQTILDYAGKAREGKIKIEDLTGGVFTISNGGVYGSLLSTPILNPPQSGILGLHKIQDRPMAVNGQVVIRPMMYLALSYDHRVVDGKEAVTFLVRIKDAIENPVRLLLEV
jgi:2-oxoglutarate dehydrogenase E2 component (dihydrolipoamide succinyltransferase)